MGTLTSKLILSLINRVTGPARAISASMDQLRAKQMRNVRQMNAMRGQMLGAAAAGYALFRALKSPVDGAADLETAMNRVRALSGATGKQFGSLQKQALELGRTTQFTASQSANAMGFLAMAGFKANDIMGAMPGTLQLAASAQIDLARAADIVSNVLTGYGLDISKLSHVNDVLVKTFTSANTDLVQLGEAMKYAGPVAKQAGVSFESTASAIALMGNAGIQGTMAGTSLRGAITRILNPTKQVSKAMKKAGLSFKDSKGKLLPLVEVVKRLEPHANDAGLFMQLFGQRAGPAMAALVSQGSGALQQLENELINSGGTAKRIADVQMQGFNGFRRIVGSVIEGMQIAIGEALIPALTRLGESLIPVIAAVTDFAEKNPELTASLIGVTAGLIGLRIAGIAAKFAFFWMRGGFLGAAITGLAGIGAAAKTAGKGLAAMRAAMVGATMLGAVGGGGGFAAAIAAMATPIATVKAGAIALGSALAAISWPIWAGIAAVAAFGLAVRHYWEPISSFVSGFASEIGKELGGVADTIGGFGSYLADETGKWMTQKAINIGSMLGFDAASVKTMINGASNIISTGVGLIIDVVKSIPSKLGSWISDIFSVKDYSAQAEAEFRDAGVSAAKAMINGIKAIPGKIISIFSGLGAKIIAAIGAIDFSSILPAWVIRLLGSGPAAANDNIRSRAAAVNKNGGGLSSVSNFGGARAAGGPIVGGRTYLVGEEGPELVTPGKSGYVNNAGATSRMAAGDGGSTNIVELSPTFNINGAQDPEAVMEMISERLREALEGIHADVEWSAA